MYVFYKILLCSDGHMWFNHFFSNNFFYSLLQKSILTGLLVIIKLLWPLGRVTSLSCGQIPEDKKVNTRRDGWLNRTCYSKKLRKHWLKYHFRCISISPYTTSRRTPPILAATANVGKPRLVQSAVLLASAAFQHHHCRNSK